MFEILTAQILQHRGRIVNENGQVRALKKIDVATCREKEGFIIDTQLRASKCQPAGPCYVIS